MTSENSAQSWGSGAFADVPLHVDPQRLAEALGEGAATGILVRAMKDGQPGTYDAQRHISNGLGHVVWFKSFIC